MTATIDSFPVIILTCFSVILLYRFYILIIFLCLMHTQLDRWKSAHTGFFHKLKLRLEYKFIAMGYSLRLKLQSANHLRYKHLSTSSPGKNVPSCIVQLTMLYRLQFQPLSLPIHYEICASSVCIFMKFSFVG